MLRPTPPRVWKSRDRHAPPRRVIQLYYAQGCFGPASAFSGASASNFRWMRRTASWSPRLRRRPARPFFFAAPKSSQRSSLERLRLRGASVARRHLAEREKSPASSVERPIGDGGVNARLFASGYIGRSCSKGGVVVVVDAFFWGARLRRRNAFAMHHWATGVDEVGRYRHLPRGLPSPAIVHLSTLSAIGAKATRARVSRFFFI